MLNCKNRACELFVINVVLKGMRGNTDVKPLTGNNVLADGTGEKILTHIFPVYTTAKAYRRKNQPILIARGEGFGQKGRNSVHSPVPSLRQRSRPNVDNVDNERAPGGISRINLNRDGGSMVLPNDWFEQIKAVYPKREGSQGWYGKPFKTMLQARLKEGHSFEDMIKGAKAYAEHCKHTKKIGTTFVMQAKRFFGPSVYFLELESFAIPSCKPVRRGPNPPTEIDREEDRRKFKEQMAKYGVEV